MKKHYNYGQDLKLKHRAQMGETTLERVNTQIGKKKYKVHNVPFFGLISALMMICCFYINFIAMNFDFEQMIINIIVKVK